MSEAIKSYVERAGAGERKIKRVKQMNIERKISSAEDPAIWFIC